MANSGLLILRVTTELATDRAWIELGVSLVSFLWQQDNYKDDDQGEEGCCGHPIRYPLPETTRGRGCMKNEVILSHRLADNIGPEDLSSWTWLVDVFFGFSNIRIYPIPIVQRPKVTINKMNLNKSSNRLGLSGMQST